MNDDDQTTAVTTMAPRLPMPPGAHARGIAPELWRILTDAIFPNAREPEKILLAFDWCRIRQLDIMKKPVNIVAMWSSELGRMSEQIWPSIGEVEITASRSKEWAGMDPPAFGPMITEKFKGKRKDRKLGWIDDEIEVTYPEWVSVTVYRMVNGQRCGFTEPCFWRENYGRIRGSALPNEMWSKRPKNQCIKVAKAFSLRAAFPEEGGGPTDEEMEGQTLMPPPPAPAAPTDNWRPPEPQSPPITTGLTAQASHSAPGHGDMGPGKGVVGPPNEEQQDEPPFDPETGEILEGIHTVMREDSEPWREWCARVLVFIRAEKELDPIQKWEEANKAPIAELLKDAPKIHTQFIAAIQRHRLAITQQGLPLQ